jgi:hypothetical protein
MRFTARFAFPSERPVRKPDFNVVPLKQRIPQDSDLFTLGNRVGRDKPDDDPRPLDVFGGFEIPTTTPQRVSTNSSI